MKNNRNSFRRILQSLHHLLQGQVNILHHHHNKKILSKKSTETVGVGKIYYTALRTNDGCSSRNRTSSMNILHSNIDERTMRRKTKIRKKSAYRTRKLVKKEREKRLINVYNNYEGRKKDKEIKSSLFYETNHIL
jgi:hypothetical protein